MKLLLMAIVIGLSMNALAEESAAPAAAVEEPGFIRLSNVQFVPAPEQLASATDDSGAKTQPAVLMTGAAAPSEAVGANPDCHCSTGTAGASGGLNPLGLLNPLLQLARYIHRPVERKLTCGSFKGEASWYSAREGHTVAGPGYRFHSNKDQAANKTLPFGTVVTLHCPSGKSIPVTIVDDGPHVQGRIIDLTRSTAEKCGILSEGHGPITMDVPCPQGPKS